MKRKRGCWPVVFPPTRATFRLCPPKSILVFLLGLWLPILAYGVVFAAVERRSVKPLLQLLLSEGDLEHVHLSPSGCAPPQGLRSEGVAVLRKALGAKGSLVGWTHRQSCDEKVLLSTERYSPESFGYVLVSTE